jgi:hypothetical protein
MRQPWPPQSTQKAAINPSTIALTKTVFIRITLCVYKKKSALDFLVTCGLDEILKRRTAALEASYRHLTEIPSHNFLSEGNGYVVS